MWIHQPNQHRLENTSGKAPAGDSEIRAWVFDIGGVILELDPLLTEKAFEALGFQKQGKEAALTQLLQAWEIGQISIPAFLAQWHQWLPPQVSDQQIMEAWNAMLLKPVDRLQELFQALSKQFPVFLLSNTNPLHVRAFEAMIREKAGIELSSLCRRCFYSHQIGFRKPDPVCYAYVTAQIGYKPGQIGFLDDTPANVEAARQFGWQAYLLSPPGSLYDWAISRQLVHL